MPLKCFTPERDQAETKFDIVAVPAIGANPLLTFRYPGDAPPDPRNLSKWRHMFKGVPYARVFMYTFDAPQDAKTHGITKYAEDLLACMADSCLGGTRFIHLVGHSTGGIVVKRALVIANGSNKPKNLEISRSCCSVAFFGTPHHGSTVLSQSVYKQTISTILGLQFPMTDRVRQDLVDVENMDGMVRFSWLFEALTVNMEKIWSFYETVDTNLQVRTRASGGTGSTKIHRMVVERRSAALSGDESAQYPSVGCEALLPVRAAHAALPRFGDDPNCDAFKDYIDQLQIQVKKLGAVGKEGFDPKWLEHELHVDVHRFHDLVEDGQTSVKLWSVRPTLHELLELGPESCLNNRVAAALQTSSPSLAPGKHDVTHPVNEPQNPMPTPVSRDAATTTKPMLEIKTENPTSPSNGGRSSHSMDGPPPTASTLVGGDGNEPSQPTHGEQSEGISDHDDDDDDAQSDASSPSAYSLPESSRFRWIHIPCNNMVWVDKLFLVVEREREKRGFEKVAESTPIMAAIEIDPEEPIPENLVMSETPTELLEHPLENPLASHLLKAKELVEQEGLSAPDLKEALMDPRAQTKLLKLAQDLPARKKTNLIPEATQMVEDTRENRIIVETVKEQIEEGRCPDLGLINERLREDRNKPRLSSAVLDEEYWLLKQMTSRHDLPHGRFMEPSCYVFLPKSSADTDSIMEDMAQHYVASIPSPIEAPQLCLYMPYLHWDTFGGLQVRNDIVQQRVQNSVSIARNPSVENGRCMECKLIWQYLVDKNNLPLHIRRTLDQYGQPHLADLLDRDKDQVLYKCTMPPDNDPFTRRIFKSVKNRASNKDDAKVLMVDQLWCWVMDSDTVATFFTPREDARAHEQSPSQIELKGNRSVQSLQHQDRTDSLLNEQIGPSSAADLSYQLYADVNGDQRFASRCLNPFDFVALTVWHAVTVFTEKMTDRDLQVFTLFEERLAELNEYRTPSFKRFRDSQLLSSSIFMGKSKGAVASKKSQEIIQALDPSYDLTALIELRDIQEELGIIGSLLFHQSEVVSDLMHVVELLDKTSDKAHPSTHAQAIRWLKEAKTYVTRNQDKVKRLCKQTTEAIDEYTVLLDMKQKQSNVIEAYFGRMAAQTQGDQNRSILVFTICTIVFLPLSFFTSLFSMNVREWTGNDTNKTLHTVVTVMVSVSVLVIIIVFCLAFSTHILNGTKRTVKSVKEGHKHFQTLREWWRRCWNMKGEQGEEEDLFDPSMSGVVTPGGVSQIGSRLDLERREQGEERMKKS